MSALLETIPLPDGLGIPAEDWVETPTSVRHQVLWLCRKFSFEVIWGMISPYDSREQERGRETMAVSFKGAHFPQDIILPCVRWYVAYPLSARHIEELMLERGVHVDHSTVNRWVIT